MRTIQTAPASSPGGWAPKLTLSQRASCPSEGQARRRSTWMVEPGRLPAFATITDCGVAHVGQTMVRTSPSFIIPVSRPLDLSGQVTWSWNLA